jgi:hypothetical protein
MQKTIASSQSQNARKLTERYYTHSPKTKCNPNQSPKTKLRKFENQKKQCPNTNAVPAGVVCYCLKMRKKTKYHNTNGIVQVLKIRKKA